MSQTAEVQTRKDTLGHWLVGWLDIELLSGLFMSLHNAVNGKRRLTMMWLHFAVIDAMSSSGCEKGMGKQQNCELLRASMRRS